MGCRVHISRNSLKKSAIKGEIRAEESTGSWEGGRVQESGVSSTESGESRASKWGVESEKVGCRVSIDR